MSTPKIRPSDYPFASTPNTPRTQALWMKHHAFSTEEEASEALCDFRDHGNALETELAAAQAECERLKFASEGHLLKTIQQQAELARLRAEVERLDAEKPWLKEANARAAHAEAALAEWSVLNLWGGTPEIIHEFIKGQQNRIHHCQDLEAELAEAVDGEINGGSIPDTLLVIHIPRSPVGYRVGQPVKVILPAIDAAMKEASK